ncbi:MAG: hypothetical protein VX405_05010 [Myxococcota bacterium]|nr:hypothetical protein [Myxococcota bacterium]
MGKLVTMSNKAMIISADRPFYEALAAVIKQEGWTADRMDPAEEDDEIAAPYDLLIFAPTDQDVTQMVQFSCVDSFRDKPLLWVANNAPPGMGAGLTRITRLEVLNRLPTMLSRAALGVSLQPKAEQQAPAVAVKEDGAGAKRELKIPTNLTADMIDMRPASVSAAAAAAAPATSSDDSSAESLLASVVETQEPEFAAVESGHPEATQTAGEAVDWDNLIPDQASQEEPDDRHSESSREAMFGAPVDAGQAVTGEEEQQSTLDAAPSTDALGSIPPGSEAAVRVAVAEAKVGVAEAKAEVAQAEARLMIAEAALMKAEAQLTALSTS